MERRLIKHLFRLSLDELLSIYFSMGNSWRIGDFPIGPFPTGIFPIGPQNGKGTQLNSLGFRGGIQRWFLGHFGETFNIFTSRNREGVENPGKAEILPTLKPGRFGLKNLKVFLFTLGLDLHAGISQSILRLPFGPRLKIFFSKGPMDFYPGLV